MKMIPMRGIWTLTMIFCSDVPSHSAIWAVVFFMFFVFICSIYILSVQQLVASQVASLNQSNQGESLLQCSMYYVKMCCLGSVGE